MGAEAVARVLGGTRKLKFEVRSNADLIQVVRDGLPRGAVEFLLQEVAIPQEEMAAALRIPSRTFSRRMKLKAFSPVESEKLVRLARVFAMALEVFGEDLPKASEWLREPNRGLGGESPLRMIDSDLGADQVLDTLGRLQEGVIG